MLMLLNTAHRTEMMQAPINPKVGFLVKGGKKEKCLIIITVSVLLLAHN